MMTLGDDRSSTAPTLMVVWCTNATNNKTLHPREDIIMSGDILQTPDAPSHRARWIIILKLPLVAVLFVGSTGWLNDLSGHGLFRYRRSGMLGKAGFPPAAVFVATCLARASARC